jgi:hypothetical protein
MILKRPSFRRGGNAGIGSLRTGFSSGSPRFINLGGANPPPSPPNTPFQEGQIRGQNIINKAKNFANKFIPRNPSGILKAAGTARVLAPGVTNPYFLAGAATLGPYAATIYQLNEARKRGELIDQVQDPYSTEFGIITTEDFENPNFYGAAPKEDIETTLTEEIIKEKPKESILNPAGQKAVFGDTGDPKEKPARSTKSAGEKSYETAYDDEVKKLEKLLGKTDYKGEVAIALSDAIGTPGSIADKASVLNKTLLNMMGAKKKQKGRIAEIAYDAVNKIKMAEIAAGKLSGNEKLQKRAEGLIEIINNPKTSEAEKTRARAELERVKQSVEIFGKGDSIQMRNAKLTALQQINTALTGIKGAKKDKDKKQLIEQLIGQYQNTILTYPEFKEDLDRIIKQANIKGLDVSKFATGGRVKRAEGTPKSDMSGAVEMEETVKETITEGPETPTAPVRKMDYAELRNRLPKEITDDVIQLISKSQEAMQDFAYIRTQGDVDSFNLKYGVNLVLPANT